MLTAKETIPWENKAVNKQKQCSGQLTNSCYCDRLKRVTSKFQAKCILDVLLTLYDGAVKTITPYMALCTVFLVVSKGKDRENPLHNARQ
jgi:hypothetical protein